MYKVLTFVSRRLQYATNLVVNTNANKRPYKVVLYGLGGMAAQHSDAITSEASQVDDTSADYSNSATVLFWLDDIIAGGGTYFSSQYVEEMVPSKKGSALLWTNTKLSGLQDNLQNHGGCPVLEGKKSVMVMWLRHSNQWAKFPCDIDKDMDDFNPIQGGKYSKSYIM